VAEIPVLEEAQTKREAALRELEHNHDSTLVTLNRTAKTIPRAFRPAHGLPLDEITELRQRAEQRTAELKKLSEAHAAVGATLKQHAATLKQLDDEYTRRVTGPTGELRRELDITADRAADAETLVMSFTAYPARPDQQVLAEEVDWSVKLIAHATDLTTQCDQSATAEHDATQAAEQQVQRLRNECHATDDAQLEQLIRTASTAEHNARRELDRGTAQQPIVTELERRIAAAAPTVAALADLSGLLTDGRFIATAVRQRQTALLEAASGTLLTISGGKFGFGENFRIVDTDTGRGRDVKTLSGGETFQASLALALAIVELASRAAGRVDSLFLDEGFGSLDAGVLQDALNALAAHSNNGRVVTIISHMRTIAEITDHVLVVEKTFTGSRCHWASPDERDRIVNDDLNRGLLE
jgi:DNA repair protein SbcC/Rad50